MASGEKWVTHYQKYPFCLSSTLGEIDNFHRSEFVQCILDTTDRPNLKIEETWSYLSHDISWNKCEIHFSILPMPEIVTSDNVPAMQAADLLAYEMYIDSDPVIEWLSEPNCSGKILDYVGWLSLKQPKRTAWTVQRQSLFNLLQKTKVYMRLYRKADIEQQHKLRDGKWAR